MTTDIDRYKRLREALDKDEELATTLLGRTGELRMLQAATAAKLGAAQKKLDEGTSAAQAVYDNAESSARAVRDSASAKLNTEYQVVSQDQAAKIAAATDLVAKADAAVKELRESIQKEWGVGPDLFPGASTGSSTIRIG